MKPEITIVKEIHFKNEMNKRLIKLNIRKKELDKVVCAPGFYSTDNWRILHDELNMINIKIKTLNGRIENYKKNTGPDTIHVPMATKMSY